MHVLNGTQYPLSVLERQDLASRPPLHHAENGVDQLPITSGDTRQTVKYRGIKAAGDDEMINILIFLTT